MHLLIDENFINIIDELQLKAKADGLIVWLKLGYKCTKSGDYNKIKSRFLKYLIDKKVGKSLSIQQARFIANKSFEKVDKKYLISENENQVSFLDFYKEEENKGYQKDFELLKNMDIDIINQLKNTTDLVPMYRKIGA